MSIDPKPGEKILWKSNLFKNDVWADPGRFYTEEFLEALRLRPQLCAEREKPFFEPGRPSVGIHLRRGDVEADSTRRIEKNSYYIRVVNSIRKKLPNADVHVFTSLEPRWKSEQFDVFR